MYFCFDKIRQCNRTLNYHYLLLTEKRSESHLPEKVPTLAFWHLSHHCSYSHRDPRIRIPNPDSDPES